MPPIMNLTSTDYNLAHFFRKERASRKGFHRNVYYGSSCSFSFDVSGRKTSSYGLCSARASELAVILGFSFPQSLGVLVRVFPWVSPRHRLLHHAQALSLSKA